jgi:hypothetical protein
VTRQEYRCLMRLVGQGGQIPPVLFYRQFVHVSILASNCHLVQAPLK